MIKVLFSASEQKWAEFKNPLLSAYHAAGLKVYMSTDIAPPEVDYIVYAPDSGLCDFTPFTKAKAVFSLWAGVESITGNPTLTLPLVRMVEPGLSEGMRDWVIAHVMRHHVGLDAHVNNPQKAWHNDIYPPLSKDRKVCILGLGALGCVCARALANLGFNVHGWSRRQKNLPGVSTHHGDDGLMDAVQGAHFLVLLLPMTAHTANTANGRVLAHLAQGAFVLNPGRGALIDDEALLTNLDSGHIAHATLDVFRIEPLPQDHAFWAHPRVTITPHIASATRPDTAADVIATQIVRCEAGKPLQNVVNRTAGY